MGKHTLSTLDTPDSSFSVSSQRPVSSGHYRIVNGVERTSEHPPVIITEKKPNKISSGNIPSVLDPALAKRSRTLTGLTAVTMPELPAVIAEQAPVSQEPAPSPDTLRSPMRHSKPPAVHKQTVIGLDISDELAKLQARRVEEHQRRKALDDFLDGIDIEPFVLKPRNSEVGWFVRAAFGSLDFDGKNVSVLSAGKTALAFGESLPDGFRQVALAAVRTRINDVVTRIAEILWDKGDAPAELTDADRARITRVGNRIALTLPEDVKALIDPEIVAAAYVAATVRRAADILENKNGLAIGGFFSLFTQGWIPVGIMNDGDFLVITK